MRQRVKSGTFSAWKQELLVFSWGMYKVVPTLPQNNNVTKQVHSFSHSKGFLNQLLLWVEFHNKDPKVSSYVGCLRFQQASFKILIEKKKKEWENGPYYNAMIKIKVTLACSECADFVLTVDRCLVFYFCIGECHKIKCPWIMD